MLIDSQLRFSDSQVVGPGDEASDNVIDLSSIRHIGQGKPLAVIISVETAADGTTGDETYSFDLYTDSTDAFSSPADVTNRRIEAVRLTAGSLHEIPIPAEARCERYLRITYDLGGTTPSVTVSAWLAEAGSTPNVNTYANGYDTV